jgi:hypothetical protein
MVNCWLFRGIPIAEAGPAAAFAGRRKPDIRWPEKAALIQLQPESL